MEEEEKEEEGMRTEMSEGCTGTMVLTKSRIICL